MEDYKRKLELAKERYNSTTSKEEKEFIETLFPELKESEDEKIRKMLIKLVKKHLVNHERCIAESWLEKQGKQKLCMIQWKGDNLKEVISFTGKNKNFDKWFTSFEEYERYVHKHNNIFKLFNEDGSHYEVPVGAWIVKTPDGYNVASKAVLKQKPADKIDPKFKVGDWIYHEKSGNTIHINRIENCTYISDEGATISFGRQDDWRNWTIQDAKDGDVLTYYLDNGKVLIMIYECLGKSFDGQVNCHALLDGDYFSESAGSACCKFMELLTPSTKEQCDLLFQKMHHSGYEWDAEKKELKKIKLSCYHDDGLYYAIDILEKTLGKVEGYQSDDGKMEHQIAIETVNALYHKKPAEWSEEDREMLDNCLGLIQEIDSTQEEQNWLKTLKDRQPQPTSEWGEEDEKHYQGCLNLMRLSLDLKPYPYYNDYLWLKSLKDKIQPQPKQTQQKSAWSEEDEYQINTILHGLDLKRELYKKEGNKSEEKRYSTQYNWLKSLKPQNNWKPSEKQLEELARITRGNSYPHLSSLYNELKKL